MKAVVVLPAPITIPFPLIKMDLVDFAKCNGCHRQPGRLKESYRGTKGLRCLSW